MSYHNSICCCYLLQELDDMLKFSIFLFCYHTSTCWLCAGLFLSCLQATELDVIHGQAVEASENVKDGNEQVRGVSHMFMHVLYVLFEAVSIG